MRLPLMLSAACFLTACSQDISNVQVDRKGHLFYAQSGATQARPQASLYATPKLHGGETSAYNPDYRFTHGREHVGLADSSTRPVTVKSLEPLPKSNLFRKQESWVDSSAAPIASQSYTSYTPSPVQSRSLSQPSYQSQYNFVPPVEASVISGYGKKENGAVNDGINYLIPAGEPVYASGNGEVAYSGDELKSYGQMVIIKHNNSYNTSYAHLGRSTVGKGERIKQGQIIGYVGQTGNVNRPQLHFAIRKGSEPVDPNSVLSQRLAAN